MIPKVIHYCWFGGKSKSKLILKCIESWKMFCPDWEIIEWNENNYDVNKNLFCKQAYKNEKWAFVSDYARFDILNTIGGVYMDTDVEILQPIDNFLKHRLFSGHETDCWIAPGLILGSESGNEVVKYVIDLYNKESFLDDEGKEKHKTVGEYFTAALKEYGIVPDGHYQEINGIAVYEKEFFCPLDDSTGVMTKTENTHTIHWYSKTWISPKIKLRTKITRICHRIFGKDCFYWLKERI